MTGAEERLFNAQNGEGNGEIAENVSGFPRRPLRSFSAPSALKGRIVGGGPVGGPGASRRLAPGGGGLREGGVVVRPAA